MDPELKLSTSSLDVGFDGKVDRRVLFRDLNLQIMSSRLVCLMGPNGVGKSSLIRTLAGLQRPLAGRVDIHSPDPTEVPRNISVVLTHRIQGNMTSREVVAFGRYPYLGWNIRMTPEDVEQVEEAIALTDIGAFADTPISRLSDGQIQMVMIARALAQQTPIILLDEPTAHLDLNNRLQIMKLLRTLCREMNKAIVVSTHELDLALQTADLIWLSGTGKNILQGVPEDLVLSGSFDDIFRFKGFDLRTGRIVHQAHRNLKVNLTGTGHEYLWTRNALERTGFVIDASSDAVRVDVRYEESKPLWVLTKEDRLHRVSSIAELIELI